MRRRELLVAGAGALAAGSLGLAGYRILSAPADERAEAPHDAYPTPERARPLDELTRRIAEELDFLTFASDVFPRFREDLRTTAQPTFVLAIHGITWPGLLLLSTDFFQNGADETRTIQYERLYHPYKNPCYDPFRRG